jgi:hypothetical protein
VRVRVVCVCACVWCVCGTYERHEHALELDVVLVHALRAHVIADGVVAELQSLDLAVTRVCGIKRKIM